MTNGAIGMNGGSPSLRRESSTLRHLGRHACTTFRIAIGVTTSAANHRKRMVLDWSTVGATAAVDDHGRADGAMIACINPCSLKVADAVVVVAEGEDQISGMRMADLL